MSAPNRCSIRSTASLFLLTWSPWQLRQCGQHRLYLLLEPECPVTHHPDKSFHRFHIVTSTSQGRLQHHTHQEVSLLGASGPHVTQVSCGFSHTCRVWKVLARGLGRRIGSLTLHWDLKEVLRKWTAKQRGDNKRQISTNASQKQLLPFILFFASSPKQSRKQLLFDFPSPTSSCSKRGSRKVRIAWRPPALRTCTGWSLQRLIHPANLYAVGMIWVVNFTKCQDSH